MNKRITFLFAAGLLLAPSQAQAHAHLMRSTPAEGSQLHVSPTVIRLWFSERPELPMTFAQLRGPDGKWFQLGPAMRQDSAELGIEFQVKDSLSRGRYVLAWRTAASDGHPSHGHVAFQVLSAATEASPPTQNGAVDSAGPVSMSVRSLPTDIPGSNEDAAASAPNSLARSFLFVGLLVAIGTVTFTLIILRGAAGVGATSRELMMRRAAFPGMAAAAVIAVAALLRLHFESQMMEAMPDMPGMVGMSIREMVMETTWGFAFRVQLAGALVAFVAFALAARRMTWAWYVAAVAAIVLALTPALSGHAAAAPRFTSLMVFGDWLHVLGAGSWLGSLLCVMAIGVPAALQEEGDERWRSVSSLVNEFSRLALVAVGAVVVSGIFASWMHLTSFADLWRTTYGVTLLVKLALVGVTLAIGAYNFKRVQPQLALERGAVQLRKSATLELATGFLILLVTGLLTGTSP